ncbi:MAG: hypothetical protein PWR22_350 [Moorella sp. (in: firmicutes)]|jgi:hypothetical protein|uniref:hypothetical protein n=2 Tax=unclassified Neomoorella TaxID=2676739 RepID=UPI0010FFADC9|nr:hypothetical protein [Moorella sp. E306M]MDK2815722.1 hypothetical protein [Moorella sp. (in: firmicutes)]MDK2895242.1 hypothetical protein [Moorella sp. (in: firmicutes)]GEA17428.1 hypothetical protein E306M_05620 [Moorella sp. E306M]
MACRDKLVNQEVLEALLDDYLRRKTLPATYKNYLLRLIEGQVNILVHNLLQMVDGEGVNEPGRCVKLSQPGGQKT